MVAAAVVGFCGSRASSFGAASFGVLPSLLVSSVLASGRGVAVGCAAGADLAVSSAVLAAGGASSLSVFCAFGPGGRGGAGALSAVAGVSAAAAAGASVWWWAGGSVAVPLRGRLAARSAALVRSVAAGGAGSGLVGLVASPCPSGLVPSSSAGRCFGGSGSGSWASLAFAAGLGLPVLVCPSGGSSGLLPRSWGGSWVPAAPPSSPWGACFRFVPAASPASLPLLGGG